MQRATPLAELAAIFFHTVLDRAGSKSARARVRTYVCAARVCMGVVSIPSLISTRSLFSTHISAVTPISTGAYKPVSTVWRDYKDVNCVPIPLERYNVIYSGWTTVMYMFYPQAMSSLSISSWFSLVCPPPWTLHWSVRSKWSRPHLCMPLLLPWSEWMPPPSEEINRHFNHGQISSWNDDECSFVVNLVVVHLLPSNWECNIWFIYLLSG